MLSSLVGSLISDLSELSDLSDLHLNRPQHAGWLSHAVCGVLEGQARHSNAVDNSMCVLVKP